MSDTTRKAVVTTAQVQAALDIVNAALTKLDPTHKATEFDRGGRRGGFAEYRGDESVVRYFTTKDEALAFYAAYGSGMLAVLDSPNVAVVEHATEAAIVAAVEAGEQSVTADKPSTSRRKAAASA